MIDMSTRVPNSCLSEAFGKFLRVGYAYLFAVCVVLTFSGLGGLRPAHAASQLTVTVNALQASSTTVQAGQTLNFTAKITASQTVANYPLLFAIRAPGATSNINIFKTVNLTAGKAVTESGSWTVPTGSALGTYSATVGIYNPAWTVRYAYATTNFTVKSAAAAVSSLIVPGPSAALAPFYSCRANFYVSTTGSDSGSGSQASPWRTIQHADSSARKAGDCINVASGTYTGNILIQHGGNAPTPTGYVVYRCMTLDGCHVLASGPGHLWGLGKGSSFTVVDGFELDGNNALKTDGIADACIGSDGATYGTGQSAHHIWVLNNIIHHCNLAGVSLNNKEWYYVMHNIAYHNAYTSGYQGSGIDLVVVQCIESGNASCASGATYKVGTGTYKPSGMDLTYAPPFHIVVSNNIAYSNMIARNNPVPCGGHTDGNGIIMDTFYDQTTGTIPYPYRSLVFGNVSYGNGGRGIHVFRTSNVTVMNNTAYGNGTDTCIDAYYLADLSQSGGSNNVWTNNIAQSVLSAANPACGALCGHRNTPLVAGKAGGDGADTNNSYSNNVLYGGYGAQLFDNDVSYFSCSKNKCNTNPQLLGPNAGNFALQTASPAIGYALAGSTTPDAGACPKALLTCY